MEGFTRIQDLRGKERNRSIEEDLLQPRYGQDLNLYEEGDKPEPIRGHRPPERPQRKVFWIAAIIVLLVIIIGLSGTVVVLLNRQTTSTSQNIPPTATPTVTSSATPTPTPSPLPESRFQLFLTTLASFLAAVGQATSPKLILVAKSFFTLETRYFQAQKRHHF